MILPTKHIKISNSLLNVGATLLRYIEEPQTVTSLWNETRILPEINTFERFTLGLDFLFILGIIDFKDGLLRRIEK
ncbi:hypothetical protein KKB18_07140 [bacterium]|nr:hypothetical protein [bacterium]